MEQGFEELDGPAVEVGQELEAMQLSVLPMQSDNNCLVEVLELQLIEEVGVVGVVVQLAELVVVVVVVRWALEQSCEELYGTDDEFEQPLEAMLLHVPPMSLADKKVAGQADVDIVE